MPGETMKFSKRARNMQPSDIREIGKLTADPEIISFAGGMPDPDFFPMEELRAISNTILQEDGKVALQYNATKGYLPLREKIASRMLHLDVNLSAEDIIIVSGSQQGIDFCGKLFLDEGDIVVCESPSYSGALNAFSSYLPEFVEMPTDEFGMDMEALEKIVSTTKNIKILYVIPDFQNPTGKTWSLERRLKLLELANRFNLLIIEDDPYSSFRFQGNRIPALKALDTQGRVIYMGTFSKTLCPGLRVGWVAGKQEIIDKIELVKQVADIHTNSFAQRQIDKFMELYDLDEQVRKVTDVYRKRRDVMLESIRAYFPSECHYTTPEGGIFIWVEMPTHVNARTVLLDAIDQKVAFIPGGGFFPNSKKENTIRLNFSTMDDGRIIKGIKRLGRVLEQAVHDKQ
jgi:2-aminoadipate transaminase